MTIGWKGEASERQQELEAWVQLLILHGAYRLETPVPNPDYKILCLIQAPAQILSPSWTSSSQDWSLPVDAFLALHK